MTEKIKIDKVVVVEGRDDTANLKRFYDVDTYETGGSSIDDTDLMRLKRLQQTRGLIVFTDPDFQGERIRKIIMQAIPEAAHVFINREEGKPKSRSKGHSLGVEHADFDSLQKAFSSISGNLTDENFLTELSKNKKSSVSENSALSKILQADLIEFGLILQPDSRRRREFLCHELRIGYANGKQLLKRLNMFNISHEQIEKVMNDYN
ncbi:ribonuclease M5 [Lactococcus nasutitermitis]|uniref:Ribonuclease M5 n=1 Tax=Lactococcus nasutitermitis TaxID=1652957 RepID=A0ABV9J9K4_9LACT|nr:ribonuclease M5 [Lactococcus nasutitermitis]